MDHRSGEVEVWGGIEYTLNRVHERWLDQLDFTSHATRCDDLDRLAGLGLRALRYPVLWERVAPTSLSHPDWAWTDARLERLRELGIRPIVGLLHHGSGPAYTSLLDPQFPVLFEAFAAQVAARYPWVTEYTPINEPLTTARFSALYGLWYPHHRSDRSFVRALMHQVHGIVRAMRRIWDVQPQARLIQTEDCGASFGAGATARQVRFENQRRWLTFDLIAGRVDDRHPLAAYLRKHGATDNELAFLQSQATPPDVVGLNYYLTSDRYLDPRLHLYPPSMHGGNGRVAYADVEAVRVRDEGIAGHEAHMLEAWARYHLPIAMTEVQLGCTREEQVRWLLEAWEAAGRARAQGADVIAITPWALFGSYDWDSLVVEARGHYEPGAFDVRSDPPRPTLVATAIGELASGRQPGHASFQAQGWWRRPERLLYVPTLSRQMPASTRPPQQPVLVLGGTGTLGAAFERICRTRGLTVRTAGRADVDITRPASVEALIARVNPWAVINATGYVRVDDAECDQVACFDVNTVAAVSIATICAEHGLPLVMFSSDLVFDGRGGQPYTEDDEPCPLNVYGASKAEAERRVRAVMPEALIIRTSAFFGPWDRHNFAVQVLDSLHHGRPFLAADDLVVSPTYVPDLVNAALDLLMDGEHGLWHLANTGRSATWFDFACEAAETCGARRDLVQGISASAIGWPAARPAFSALTSIRGAVMRSRSEALEDFAVQRDRRPSEAATA